MTQGRTPSSGPQNVRAAGRVLVPALLLVATVAAFASNVRHYAFLSDDAFISFRYAAHLVEGQGLVWNPGERVEGYTNFLWVLLMAASLAVGAAPEQVSNALGIASGAALLTGLLVFSARRSSWSDPFVYLAPLALASSRSFTAWCTGGLETLFFSALVFAAFAAFLRERERGTPWPLLSSLLFGLAGLTRPEGSLFAAIAGACFAAEIALGRRPLRSGLAWGLPWALLVGSHLLWRHAYYGFWLPNSFYAKVPAPWLEQGLRYLGHFADDYRIAWLAPLLLPSLLLRRDAVSGLFAAILGVYLAYVVTVGGDRFEFRFLVPVLPYFYWLLGDSLGQLARLPVSSRGLRIGLATACLAIAALVIHATRVGSVRPQAIRYRDGINPVQAVAQYGRWRAEEGRFLRQLIDDGLLPADLVIAVTGAGAVPYYTGWPTVDRHGLNDVHIAHQPLAERGVIAHERDASWAYLEERGVAIIDAVNRIVHRTPRDKYRKPRVEIGGREVPLQLVNVRDRYLIFASTLPPEELQALFGELPVRR
jgi:hypothetical protein